MSTQRQELEDFVVDAALGCGVLTHSQVEVARLQQRALATEGTGQDLLSLLAQQVDGETNLHLSAIYQEVVSARTRARRSGSDVHLHGSFGEHPSGSGRSGLVSSCEVSEELSAQDTITTGTQGEAKPSAQREEGDSIGPFRIQREIGRGGMGLVYEATDSRSGERVALKVLLQGANAKPDDVERFQVEARAAQRLEHPNLVGVLDHGCSEDATWYMALEFVEGRDLSDILKEGALEPEEAVEIARDLAQGLAVAHSKKILHRDLKPHNVMIEADGTPRLTDFGLAKIRDDSSASLTASGAILGTPAYMSPEQADGDRHQTSARTDVYGLGATLFHMLTGSPPFGKSSMTAILIEIVSKPPPRPSQLVPDLDPELDAIVFKCLAKKPLDRYASMNELSRDLNRWLNAVEVLAPQPSPWERAQAWVRGRPERAPMLGVVTAAALVCAALVAWSQPAPARSQPLAPREVDATPALVVVPPPPSSQESPRRTPDEEPEPDEPQPSSLPVSLEPTPERPQEADRPSAPEPEGGSGGPSGRGRPQGGGDPGPPPRPPRAGDPTSGPPRGGRGGPPPQHPGGQPPPGGPPPHGGRHPGPPLRGGGHPPPRRGGAHPGGPRPRGGSSGGQQRRPQ